MATIYKERRSSVLRDRFSRVNWIAATFFSLSSALLLKVDWRASQLLRQPLLLRLSYEPRVMVLFVICFLSVTWMIGFFTLGLLQVDFTEPLEKALASNSPSTVEVTTTTVKHESKTKIAILGGTGLVGRALAIHLSSHPKFRLQFLVGSPDTAGKPLKGVWQRKENILKKQYGDIWKPMLMPESLEQVVVSSFDDILTDGSPNNMMIISCIAPSLGWMEDKLMARGFDVFSISPHARTRPGVPLIVPEVNGPELLTELLQDTTKVGRLVKSPNCVSCGVCIVLDAIRKAYGGLKEISITTFQSLSGRGDALYDSSLVVGNILPLGRTEEDTNRKIREEVSRVLGDPELPISVTAQRVFTQRGHYVDVRVKTELPVLSEQHAALALERYSPFVGTDFADLPDAPKPGPIRVSMAPQWPRPVQCIDNSNKDDQGMAIYVGHISTDDRVFDLTLSFVVDNVARGAYGAAILTAEIYDALNSGIAQ